MAIAPIFRAGTAIETINTDLLSGTLAVDTFIPSDDVEIINTGIEFTILERSNVQLGYRGLETRQVRRD